MSHVFSVAKELVKLSLAGDESDPLTNLRLQKLLYYAQAWSLVLRETELFPEESRAWRYGPVVEAVYQTLPSGRCAAWVPADAFAMAPDVDAEDAAFLRSFWEAYSQYSASQLYRLAHSELPWQKTRGQLAPSENGNDPIPVAGGPSGRLLRQAGSAGSPGGVWPRASQARRRGRKEAA